MQASVPSNVYEPASRRKKRTPPPPPHDTFDASRVDLDGFLAELRALRREVDASLGERDLTHLSKIERIGRLASAVGYATAWIAPNPLSAAALSLGRSTRWLLMHHVGHNGYDRVPGVEPRHTSKVFARGRRRFLDWPDWMLPEAWIYEHNILHHGHTGEERDPDLVERNASDLRESNLPKPIRKAVIAAMAATWRFSYYAPKTLGAWRNRHGDVKDGELKELWTKCYLPYALSTFGLVPALYLPLGPWAATSVLLNSLMAEVLTNVHTFLVVGPNHTGDDLYRFSGKPASTGERMLRQVLGSANYPCGTELVDYLHLWLNYQIEHHIFPDLPMLRYREIQPKVKALCEKYGIPYVQESVFTRFRKMIEVAVGDASMKHRSTIERPRTAAAA